MPGSCEPPRSTNPNQRKALPIMTQTATTAQQACMNCGGTGQVQTPIENTATGQTTALTETCLDCL